MEGPGRTVVLILGMGMVGAVGPGCGASTHADEPRTDAGRGGAEGGLGGMTPGGGLGGMTPGGGQPAGPTACDATKAPNEDACVIDERYGLFVSPLGDDEGGDGSRAHPYATLWKAITEAEARSKRVYACATAGPYQSAVYLDTAANGLEMYGGFSCADWTYSTFSKSQVMSSGLPALYVEWVYGGLRLEDFGFETSFGTNSGESSVAAVILTSPGVLLRRVELKAGMGISGADGNVHAFMYEGRPELDGNDATGVEGAAEKVCQCAWRVPSTGDFGALVSTPGQNGSAGMPELAPCEERADTPTCEGGATGQRGADAAAVAAAPGASTLGTVTIEGSTFTDGWRPAAGENGAAGPAGQGGAGGACTSAGGGGGGGCGSCGGAGGPGGQGGGASIALLVDWSTVSIEDSTLMARDGGLGGNGAAGQIAQREAGLGGQGVNGGCPGGSGGLGADGAAGGGGAGGISVGILWVGAAPPTQTGVTITIGRPGKKGIGGEPGVNDGIDGIARDVLEAPPA